MDKIIIEKFDTIKDLQGRLDLAQRKLSNYIADSSSKGYTNVKAMHERYKKDREKYAIDLYANEVSESKMKSDSFKRLFYEYVIPLFRIQYAKGTLNKIENTSNETFAG